MAFMRVWLRSVTSLGACVAFLDPAVAAAYCPTTTCANGGDGRPTNCIDNVYVCETGGTPLAWPRNCLSFSVQVDGSKKFGITADQLQQLVRTCYDNWQNVHCAGGGKPDLYVETYPQVDCTEARVNMHGPNQNLWVFHDEKWPYADNASSTIALTTVKFNPDSGEIYDGDVELNSANFDFTLEAGGAGTDLQSVIQHESGHILGLADLYNLTSASSTMYGNYGSGGDLTKRTLEADDIAGVCAVFPPVSNPSTTCDPTPRGGFTTKCAEPDDAGCTCTVAQSSAASAKSRWQLLGILSGLLAVTGRRRYGQHRRES
jgi:hypothetical protein